ncbi:hypothetical protein F5Y03DRAFT_390552 [Xylaria venustula]|nr:hypothetical protein F5Y03DRAFT_390552 [Xylaria venustula]
MAKYTIHPAARLGTIPAKTITALTAELSNMTIENDARRIVQENIKRLRDMGTYRGRRHAMGLPVRGQNTRTQIETAKKLNTLERGGCERGKRGLGLSEATEPRFNEPLS